MNKILVAVDGSLHAEKALEIAASLAKQNKNAVTVLHCTTDKGVSPRVREGLEIEYAHEIQQRLRSTNFQTPHPNEELYATTMLSHSDNVAKVVNTVAGEVIIQKAVSRLHKDGVDNVDSALLSGDPAEQIIEIAKTRAVDTIVMGCRGTGKLRGLLLGSVSQSVAHDAECSVVIVK